MWQVQYTFFLWDEKCKRAASYWSLLDQRSWWVIYNINLLISSKGNDGQHTVENFIELCTFRLKHVMEFRNMYLWRFLFRKLYCKCRNQSVHTKRYWLACFVIVLIKYFFVKCGTKKYLPNHIHSSFHYLE